MSHAVSSNGFESGPDRAAGAPGLESAALALDRGAAHTLGVPDAAAAERTDRPEATVSVDLDPVDLHLASYGIRSLPPDPLIYARAIPRLLEVFDRCGMRATLFVVARDATAHRAEIAEAVFAGHEIASHSLTHPLGLSRLSAEALRREFAESRWLLEETSGTPVVGFRAPQFDMSARALDLLAAAGYAYDASACPSPMLVSTRLSQLLMSRGRSRLGILPFTWRRTPHRLGTGRTVLEFPLSVTPFERRPLHHSLRFRMSDRRFDRLLAGFAGRREPLSYLLHAIDVLALVEDHVDPRLAGYSGMDRRLPEKVAILERTLRAIAARFETKPYRERLTTM